MIENTNTTTAPLSSESSIPPAVPGAVLKTLFTVLSDGSIVKGEPEAKLTKEQKVTLLASLNLHTERLEHHKFGPSSLKSRRICPGWKNNQGGDKTAAIEGTMMHLAFERRDMTGLNDEQASQVQKCIDYVTPLETGALIVLREARLDVLDGQTFGTADLVILRRLKNGRLHIDVVDEKYGKTEVDDAADNDQGYAYVLGAWDLPGEWRKAESCTVHFLSPRLDDVSRHTFYKKDIPRLSMITSTTIGQAEHWDKTRDPSMLRMNETNCSRCARKATGECHLATNYVIAHAKAYRPLEVAEETHSSRITDPVKMGQFYIALRVLEKMVDSGKKHVAEFALEHDIPGFTRRERKGKVTVNNSVAAWPVLLKTFGIEKLDDPQMIDLINCATFSYADLQNWVSEKAGKGKAKTAAVAALWTDLQNVECVYQAEPSAYLQRDKEEPVTEISATEVPAIAEAPKAIEAPAPTNASCVQGAAVD